MRKKSKWITVFLVFTFFTSVTGCVPIHKIGFIGGTNRPCIRKDLSSFSPLKVVTIKNDEGIMLIEPTLGEDIAVVSSALFGGPLGMAIASSAVSMAKESPISLGKKLKVECTLSDFGQLVKDKFAARIYEEIPGWPTMTKEDTPLEPNDISKYKSEYLIIIFVMDVKFDTTSIKEPFSANTFISLKAPDGSFLWAKRFIYKTSDFSSGKRSWKELLSDNCRLLKEEVDFAAEQTVSNFIEHFKTGG
jgi:hypothetical protein